MIALGERKIATDFQPFRSYRPFVRITFCAWIEIRFARAPPDAANNNGLPGTERLPGR